MKPPSGNYFYESFFHLSTEEISGSFTDILARLCEKPTLIHETTLWKRKIKELTLENGNIPTKIIRELLDFVKLEIIVL